MLFRVLPLTIIFCVLFINNSFSAIDVKNGRTQDSVSESMEKNWDSSGEFSNSQLSKFRKRKLKKKRFRLFKFLKWKKKKSLVPGKETVQKKKIDPFIFCGGALTIFGLGLFAILNIGFFFPSFLGAILGLIGLIRIKRKPEKRSGKVLGWISIGMFFILTGLYFVFFAIG